MNIVNRIILIFNYLSIIFLLTSYLAPFVSPENFTFIALFGLAFPAIAAINFIFVVYWLLLWKKDFLLSLIALAPAWFIMNGFVSFGLTHKSNAETELLKVMSYNVKLFDLYNRPHNIVTRNKIIELIKDQSPNIICLQEFYTDDTNTFNTLDTLLKTLQAKNYHTEYLKTVLEKHHFGLATFSTYPIINRDRVAIFSERDNGCIYTDVKIGNDTLRIYNIHLQSIHLSNVVYIDSVLKTRTREIFEHSTKNIISKLFGAFRKRAPQADEVVQHMKNCRYPIIVCSDLNDTPSSYTYRTVKNNLADAFKETGMGFGETYAGKIPFLRIDYIFHSTNLKAIEFNVIPEKLSDHYPICSKLYLEKY